MILQKIKKSIEKIGIPCFLDYNDATSYCAILIPETNGKESIKVDIQFIWEDGNPILLADEWIKSLRMNKELKAIVLGSENNYAGYVLRVKVIDVSICSYIHVNDTPKYNISIDNDPTKGTVSGAGQYKEGKTCTISCTPFEQYYFDGWNKFVSGEDNWESDGTIYDNPYSFTVDQDLMFEAIYGSKYHVEVVSAGNGTVSGSGYYGPTESCTITATPNTGYHFVNWTVSGLELTTSNPYTFIPTGDITITANFAINTYTIATGGIGGTITGSGTYNYGATCTLTATPNAGYEFVSWTEYGETISTLNPYSFTVNSDRTITADFNQLSYTVSATSSGNGSVSGGGTYHYGDSITLTATPDEGYRFVNWTEGGSTLSSSNPYTFSCTGNQTIVGNFALSIPLTINAKNNASVILTNANNETYTLNLTAGENVYTGTQPGFGLSQITGLIGHNETNITSIDASGLTSWTVIENQAFYGCENLLEIKLPNTITTIGSQSFAYCYGLTTLTLPATLTTIDGWAFNYTQNLAILTLLSTTPPTLGQNAFDGIYDEFLVYVPVGKVSDYQSASGWGSLTYAKFEENTPVPSVDYIDVECINSSSVILTNSNNQTYTWNLSRGKNYYTGTESGFAINEITNLKKGSSNANKILVVDASDLTNWTVMENQSFVSCSRLVSITLPDSITSIGIQAFTNCNKLKQLTLPDTLISINNQAFGNCGGLISLNIPENVNSIGQGAFASASKIFITVDSNNATYDSRNNCSAIIETATNTLVFGFDATIIPNTVLAIGNLAFNGCTFSSITIPDSITRIGNQAFQSCMSLESINISANVNYIGWGPFENCRGLTSITVDSNNTVYNDGNGSNCIIKTSTNTLIQGCKTTVIPNTVVEIGDNAFEGCRFTSITLPNSITLIGPGAFLNCTNLTTFTVPSSVNVIGSTAFWNINLSYIEFEGTTPATLSANNIFSGSYPIYVPSSAVSDYQTAWPTYASRIMAKPEPSVSDYLRIDANGNTSVILTNSNNETYTWNLSDGINYYEGTEPGFAINEITGLKRNSNHTRIIYIDASKLTSWTTIENEAFNACNSLQSILLPSSITSIGNTVFSNCTSLPSITIPDSVSSIGSSAFGYCYVLTSITLPSSLTDLGAWAFISCNSLTSITCLATTPPTIGSNAFQDTNDCPIYVPSASVSAYQTAWSTYASRIQPIP